MKTQTYVNIADRYDIQITRSFLKTNVKIIDYEWEELFNEGNQISPMFFTGRTRNAVIKQMEIFVADDAIIDIMKMK